MSDPGTTRPVTVLVVDDQATYREAARFVIEMTDGFELAGTAETGEEAVLLAGRLQPDLVLMDVNLPGIDGLEATRRIVGSRPDAGVIVFSTHSAADYADRARSAGAIGFVSKGDLAPEVLAAVWSGWLTPQTCNADEDIG